MPLLLDRHCRIEIAARDAIDADIDATAKAEAAGADIRRIVRTAGRDRHRRPRHHQRSQPVDQHGVREPVGLKVSS